MTIHEFAIPVDINGDQLQKELNASILYIVEDKLVIGSELSKSAVEEIIAKHKPAPVVEPTIEMKLASAGLSLDDLKAALGL
jgi:hypothetical protein